MGYLTQIRGYLTEIGEPLLKTFNQNRGKLLIKVGN